MITPRIAANVLLAVNLVMLCGFTFILLAILLENNPDMYAKYYHATHGIQPLIIYSWFLSLALSPLLVLAFLLRFGRAVRKSIQWKISMGLMVIVGLPSLALAGVGILMGGSI